MTDATYIKFVYLGIPLGKKTKRWCVYPKDGAPTIGEIRWFGRWRKYCFFPAAHTVFEQVCLREIADFIEARTSDHRKHQVTESGAAPTKILS